MDTAGLKPPNQAVIAGTARDRSIRANARELDATYVFISKRR